MFLGRRTFGSLIETKECLEIVKYVIHAENVCFAGGADRKSERNGDSISEWLGNWWGPHTLPRLCWPDSRHHSVQFHALTVSCSVAMSLTRAFSPALRELRILFSQTGNASDGVR
jgi:hypothetical protein